MRARSSAVRNQRIGPAKALAAVGACAEAALPVLQNLKNDPSETVRKTADEAIEMINPKSFTC